MSIFERWRAQGLFVSSTFEDMHAERDFLQNVVLPELAERLRSARHRLKLVDLRWGIDTVPLGSEEARHLLVLHFCLVSLRNCRPFMMVLLGDRYGWLPPVEALRRAALEMGFRSDVKDKSVTALEIEFGVLDRDGPMHRTHFFERRLPYDAMADADRARFSDAHRAALAGTDLERAEAQRGARLLADFKLRIADLVPAARRHTYNAGWDPTQRKVTDLEGLRMLILENVGRDLHEQLGDAEDAPTPRDWMEAEAIALDEFVDHRTRVFCGRDELVRDYVEFCLGPVGEARRAVCVTGPAGAGKSSLFARLHRELDPMVWRDRVEREGAVADDRAHRDRLERQEVLLLGHAAGVSRRAASIYDLLRRWTTELADSIGHADPIGGDLDVEEVERLFAYWLQAASARRRVVLLFDALNQLERTPRARFLGWLPRSLPENCRLLATALPGDESAEFIRRPGWHGDDLPPLTEAAIDEVFEAVCRDLYNREGHKFKAVRQALREKEDGRGGRAGGNPLWLRLALDLLNQLDEDFFARQRLAQYQHLPGDARLSALLVEVVGQMPGNVEGLYSWLLQRAEGVAHHFGKPEWARLFACLIALSRAGLRETDLRALLPELAGEAWSDLRFAALRRAFQAHLVERGEFGQWDFFHVQMRAAVHRHYLPDADEVRRLHRCLAEHFAGRAAPGAAPLPADDPLRQREQMYHLLHAGDPRESARYYARLPQSALATGVLAEHVIVDRDGQGLAVVLALLGADGLTNDEVYWIASRFQDDLLGVLRNETKLATRIAIAEAAHRPLESLTQAFPENRKGARAFMLNNGVLGELYRAVGRPKDACRCSEKCRTIARRLTESLPDDMDAQHYVALSLNLLGDLHRDAGRIDEACRCHEECYTIRRRKMELLPDDAQAQRLVSVSLERLGDLHRDAGRTDEARRCYDEGFAIIRRLAALLPDDLEAQRVVTVSLSRLGDLHRAAGRTEEARRCRNEGLAIARRLANLLPNDVRAQQAVSVSLLQLGDVHGDAACVDEARRCYEECYAIRSRLAELLPDDVEAQRQVSLSLNSLGEMHRVSGRLDEARRCYDESFTIARRLAELLADDVWPLRDVGYLLNRLGNLHRAAGRVDEDRRCHEEVLAISRRLAELLPDDVQAQGAVSVSLQQLGALYLDAGSPDEARRCYEECYTIRSRLAALMPDDVRAQLDVSHSLNTLGELDAVAGRIDDARRRYDEALASSRRLAELLPDHVHVQGELSASLRRQSELHQAAGRSDEARRCCDEGLAIARRLVVLAPNDVQVQRDVSLWLEKLGDMHDKAGRADEARLCCERASSGSPSKSCMARNGTPRSSPTW